MNKATLLEKNPVLRNREFFAFLLLRFGLIFALSMQFTIAVYWIFHLTNYNKLALGLVGLAEVIPVVACSLFAGYLVDLSEKKKMLMWVLLGYLLLALFLACLSSNLIDWQGHTSWLIGLVFFIIFLTGILRSLYGPAAFAMVGLIVPKQHYANAASWVSLGWHVGAVLGPLLAGVLIASTSIFWGFSLVLFIELLLLLPMLRIKKYPVQMKKREPIFQSIGEGLRFIVKTPELLGAQLLDMFSVLFGGAVALLPAVQQEFFPLTDDFFSGARAFGFLRAAMGIGSLLTLTALAFYPLRKKVGRKLFICVAGFGLAIVVFGLSRNFYLSFFALVFAGIFDAVSVVIRGTILQLVTPEEMRGRVASVNTMFISSSNELGDFESGVMASWLGTSRAIVVGGLITLTIVGTTFFTNKKLKEFDFEEK